MYKRLYIIESICQTNSKYIATHETIQRDNESLKSRYLQFVNFQNNINIRLYKELLGEKRLRRGEELAFPLPYKTLLVALSFFHTFPSSNMALLILGSINLRCLGPQWSKSDCPMFSGGEVAVTPWS